MCLICAFSFALPFLIQALLFVLIVAAGRFVARRFSIQVSKLASYCLISVLLIFTAISGFFITFNLPKLMIN